MTLATSYTQNKRGVAAMSYVFVSPQVKLILNNFKRFLEEHEYRKDTIQSYSTYVSKFLRSTYCNEKERNFKQQIDEFLATEATSAPQNFKYCRAALYVYYKYSTKVPYPKKTKENLVKQIEDLLTGFQEFQKDVKHLSEATSVSEVSHVRKFLYAMYQKSADFFKVEDIHTVDICNYISRDVAYLKASTKGKIATSIRNFFRYLRFARMAVDESIFKIPLSPAIWKLNSIPTVLNESEFQALPASFNRKTPNGIRDYAIALCFLELGLRCAEVANLTLDDFDWKNGIVNIKNTKTHSDRALPISSTFGEAIVNYLQQSRPASKNRVLFVRFSHVQGDPMGRQQIRGVMRRAYKRVGINESVTGTHILRRTVASNIYKQGATLKMVADILGHESLESTAIYTKINTDALFEAAGIWPGGGSL